MTTLPAPPYSYETNKTSASVNWKTGTGNGRKVTGITIHHWGGSKGLDFDGIVNFLCSPRPANPTSAHYVAQGRDGKGAVKPRVSCIVDPDDIAYACGNWNGNLSTISIECRPECYAEDREVVAQLVARLWNTYGVVPLYPHSHWVADECPGDNWRSNLTWIANRATQILNGTTVNVSPPAPTNGTEMKPSDLIEIDKNDGTKEKITVTALLVRAGYAYRMLVNGGAFSNRLAKVEADIAALKAKGN